MLRSSDLRRFELSHVMSSAVCLSFVSFLQSTNLVRGWPSSHATHGRARRAAVSAHDITLGAGRGAAVAYYSASLCASLILRSRYHEKYPQYLRCRSLRRQSCPLITRRHEAVSHWQVICPS